jgi:DNA-binding transcriptional MocR family regulator
MRYNGFNNGSIGLSVRDAAVALNVGRSTASRAFKELQDRGFIETVRKGHFDRKARHASEWRLTEHPCNVTGSLPSKTFMRWRQQEKNATGPRDGTVGPSSGTQGAVDGARELQQKGPRSS